MGQELASARDIVINKTKQNKKPTLAEHII